MDTQNILENKINELREKGIEEEVLGGYIADAIELAFIKTLSPKVEELAEETYKQILKSIESKNFQEVIDLLINESDDIDESIFNLHLKEALEIK